MRVLLFEEDCQVAESLAATLRALDSRYEICYVSRLKDAERTAREQTFDIALIDLPLPGPAASDVAIALHRAARDLPLVVVTGHDIGESSLALLQEGVQDFLVKRDTSPQRIHEVLQLSAARQRQACSLRQQARYDPLTGAMNRRETEKQLNKAVSNAIRYRRRGALLFIDVDDFKSVNDSFGHATGDAVLKDLVCRLVAVSRAGDSLGRVGGDEFVLILEGLSTTADAAAAALKVTDAACFGFDLGDRSLPVSVSIGVAVFPDNSDTPDTLLDLADRAMYKAKRQGKGRVCLFQD